MATILAAQSGDWTDTATWQGGVVPGTDDTVYANGFDVSIDDDIEVLSLRTANTGGAAAGGVFNADTQDVTIIITGLVNTNYTHGASSTTTNTIVVTANGVTIHADYMGSSLPSGTNSNSRVTYISIQNGVNATVIGTFNKSVVRSHAISVSDATLNFQGTVASEVRGLSDDDSTLYVNNSIANITVTTGEIGGVYLSETSEAYINGNIESQLTQGIVNITASSHVVLTGDMVVNTEYIMHCLGGLTINGDVYTQLPYGSSALLRSTATSNNNYIVINGDVTIDGGRLMDAQKNANRTLTVNIHGDVNILDGYFATIQNNSPSNPIIITITGVVYGNGNEFIQMVNGPQPADIRVERLDNVDLSSVAPMVFTGDINASTIILDSVQFTPNGVYAPALRLDDIATIVGEQLRTISEAD